MYKFTIEYYYEKCCKDDMKFIETRIGVVYARNKTEAIEKLKKVDENYITFKDLTFEECCAGGLK